MSERVRRGPWRGLCFLLAAWALVQAQAQPPGAALATFRDEHALPAAHAIRAEIERWRPDLDERVESLLGGRPRFSAILSDRLRRGDP